jgi:predicted nucleic acid-binding protein
MLLDTNAISAWAKDDKALLGALRPDRTWFLPSIALGEYRYGLLKSTFRVECKGNGAAELVSGVAAHAQSVSRKATAFAPGWCLEIVRVGNGAEKLQPS